ncbi:MAG: hypothetical protein IJ001_05855 [Oscillospiraceae bacterium]|nr:hypothetical protein [Oscillospiraceae bacterium]
MSEKAEASVYQKRKLAEQLWLTYFNQTLFERGLITEAERNRIKNCIAGHEPSVAAP